MLRPREGHDIHIEQSMLEVTPRHHIHWIRDVYGNSIAVVDFTERASELVVSSEVILNHYEINPFDFYIEPEAFRYPFVYNHETSLELSTLVQPAFPADVFKVREWLAAFWQPGRQVDTLSLLQQMNGEINRSFGYGVRHEPGVQSPAQTLAMRSGFLPGLRHVAGRGVPLPGIRRPFCQWLYPERRSDRQRSFHPCMGRGLSAGGGWKGFDPTLGVLTTSQHVPWPSRGIRKMPRPFRVPFSDRAPRF